MKEAQILYKFASRSRPQKFKEAMKSILDNHSRPDLARFMFTFDDNDPKKEEYNNVLTELAEQYPTLNYHCTFGESNSKIHAINRNLDLANSQFPEWKILVCMSDDMVFFRQGFDNIIREDFDKHFPDGDGFLHYNDGYQKANCCTLSIVDRKYFNRDGWIYNPNYVGLWCDVEATETAYMRGRYKYVGDYKVLFSHVHPATKTPHPVTRKVAEWDDQYKIDENKKRWGEDSIVLKYHRSIFYGIPVEEMVNKFLFDKDAELIIREREYRKEFGNSFIYPKLTEKQKQMNQPILTISILSTTGREQYLCSMLSVLSSQIAKCDKNIVYQVIADKPTSKGGLSIGAKRNIALQSTTGLYHCFVDCDDQLWHDYIDKIVSGCLKDCDCVAFKGNYYTDNKLIKPFVHSIEFDKYDENPDFYERFPNHLNAIRTSIAKQFLFDEINHGEDTNWATAINDSGLLKTEAKIEGIVYDYYHRTDKKEFK